MRRTVEFCLWKAKWWEERIKLRTDVGAELGEGLQAYGLEQIARERQWAETWSAKWLPVRTRAAVVLREHVGDVDEEVFVPLEVELEDDAREEYEYDDFNDEDE